MQGLLSYTDFHFLLLLMSTPTRYLDIIFRGFDISADGNVEAKVTSNHHQFHCENLHFNALNLLLLLKMVKLVSKKTCQEFVYVLARISAVKTDPEELMKNAEKSGLIK